MPFFCSFHARFFSSVLLFFSMFFPWIQEMPLLGAPTSTSTSPPNVQKYWEKKNKEGKEYRSPSSEENKVSEQLRQKMAESEKSLFYQSTEGVYSFPGVVLFNEGEWQGSDNVHNISGDIGVAVEISADGLEKFPLKPLVVQQRVEEILRSAAIHPQARMVLGKPPLPLLSIALLVQKIDKGFAVLCSGSLFEEVDVKRVRLDRGTWQAITWQRQYLVVTSEEEAFYHLNKIVEEIAYSFVRLYRHFKPL